MALFSTFLLSNIDSSLLFNYRFPTLLPSFVLDLVYAILWTARILPPKEKRNLWIDGSAGVLSAINCELPQLKTNLQLNNNAINKFPKCIVTCEVTYLVITWNPFNSLKSSFHNFFSFMQLASIAFHNIYSKHSSMKTRNYLLVNNNSCDQSCKTECRQCSCKFRCIISIDFKVGQLLIFFSVKETFGGT